MLILHVEGHNRVVIEKKEGITFIITLIELLIFKPCSWHILFSFLPFINPAPHQLTPNLSLLWVASNILQSHYEFILLLSLWRLNKARCNTIHCVIREEEVWVACLELTNRRGIIYFHIHPTLFLLRFIEFILSHLAAFFLLLWNKLNKSWSSKGDAYAVSSANGIVFMMLLRHVLRNEGDMNFMEEEIFCCLLKIIFVLLLSKEKLKN